MATELPDRSWLLGLVAGDGASDTLARVAPAGGRSVVADRTLAIAAAPESDVCRVVQDGDSGSLLVCGSALARADRPDGQYGAARVGEAVVDLYGDPGGLRSLYVARRPEATWFSTHLRLLRMVGLGFDLDLRRFGSHWLGHNQLSDRFFVRGVERIAGSRTVRIRVGDPGGAEYTDVGTSGVTAVSEEPMDHVESFLTSLGRPVLVGLSGGLDSRTLLASVRHTGIDAAAFVFGDDSVDVRIAHRAASAAGLDVVRLPDADLAEAFRSGKLEEFAADMTCSVPVSAYRRIANYGSLDPDAVVVDGGFGEIGRAQLYRCVELARMLPGSHASRLGRYRTCLGHARADVFSDDVVREMEAGFREDLEEVERLVDRSTLNRPVDELGLRFRRPNFFGLGQAWIDRFGFNAMPFAREDFVTSVLALPARRRRGGRHFRRYVRRRCPELARIPLAKGTLTVPFGLPAELTPLYARLQRGTAPGNPLLPGLRELVGDLAASRRVRQCGLYDARKLDGLVGAWADRGEGEAAVDWFLSFELWRGAVLGEG